MCHELVLESNKLKRFPLSYDRIHIPELNFFISSFIHLLLLSKLSPITIITSPTCYLWVHNDKNGG